MQSWEEFKKEMLKDPRILREYKKLAPRYKIIAQKIEAKIRNKSKFAD